MTECEQACEDLRNYLCSDQVKLPTQPVGLGLSDLFLRGFSDPRWWAWRKVAGLTYDRKGQFDGHPTLTVRGDRDYLFTQTAQKFQFVRFNGEVVTPPDLVTDGGSVPRVAWMIPGIDPWIYMPAFILHDALFSMHKCIEGFPYSFEDANQVLMEGIFTMMVSGNAPEDWRLAELIRIAVSSPVALGVWSRVWTTEECRFHLPSLGV